MGKRRRLKPVIAGSGRRPVGFGKPKNVDHTGKLRECRFIELSCSMRKERTMIRKLKSGEYRLYSRKTDPKTGKRKNLGTFKSRAAAEKHERAVQFFKRQ